MRCPWSFHAVPASAVSHNYCGPACVPLGCGLWTPPNRLSRVLPCCALSTCPLLVCACIPAYLVSQATAGHMWQAHCILSASVQLGLMSMCCRPWRHIAGCLTAPVCCRSGERLCQRCQAQRAGHLGPLSARWLPCSSLPLARWVCQACTPSSAFSACRGSLFS